MARFGISGRSGRLFFGVRDGIAANRASGTANGTSTLTGNARIDSDIRASGTANGSSTLTGTASVSAPPTLTNITPAAPYPGQTGVIITGSNLNGAVVTYNGLPVTVTSPGASSLTVTWPNFIADDAGTGLELNYFLVVATAAGADSLTVQSSPEPGYLYLRTATNASGVPGAHDLSTFIVGTDFVYGIFEPDDGQWDVSRADQGIFNSIPGLPAIATWTFRIWDVTLAQWSNQSVATFNEAVSSVGLLAGTSTLSGTVRMDIVVPASGTANGASTLSGAAREGEQAFGTANGTSTLSGAARTIERASGTFAGTSTLTGFTVGNKSGSGTLAGGSTLTGAYYVTASGTAAGGSTLQGAPSTGLAVRASGTFAGTSTLTGVPISGAAGSGTFAGGSTLANGPPTVTHKRAATMAGNSTLSGFGRIPGQTIGPIDRPGVITIDTERGTWTIDLPPGIKGAA